METCNFGADDQKLTGAERKSLHVEVHVQRGLAARQAGDAKAEAAVVRLTPLAAARMIQARNATNAASSLRASR